MRIKKIRKQKCTAACSNRHQWLSSPPKVGKSLNNSIQGHTRPNYSKSCFKTAAWLTKKLTSDVLPKWRSHWWRQNQEG